MLNNAVFQAFRFLFVYGILKVYQNLRLTLRPVEYWAVGLWRRFGHHAITVL